MASYYDDPEFYESAFTKLVGLLRSRDVFSEDKETEYLDLVHWDGLGVPFDVMVSDLLAMGPPTLTTEEYSLLALLGGLDFDAWEYPELIEALNTSPEHTPSSGLIHS